MADLATKSSLLQYKVIKGKAWDSFPCLHGADHGPFLQRSNTFRPGVMIPTSESFLTYNLVA